MLRARLRCVAQRGANQSSDCQVGAAELGDDAASAENKRAARDTANLFKVGGDHADRASALLRFEQQAVDFRLGADVNSVCRLLEHEQFSVGAERSGENHFLLVSAA